MAFRQRKSTCITRLREQHFALHSSGMSPSLDLGIFPLLWLMTEADGQLAASATQRDRVALLFDSYLLTHGVEIILGSRVEGGGVWWNVTPLSSLFVLRLHTYLQTTASRYLPADLLGSFISTGSPFLFTLPWRLVVTTVKRQAVSQVLATRSHAGYLHPWKR